MSNYTYCRTLRLDWDEVSRLIGKCAGAILNRPVRGTAGSDDGDYWGFQAADASFTIAEIDSLIGFVKGDREMQAESVPVDSEESRFMGERLSRALLEKELRQSWCHESATELALWLINVREKRPMAYKRMIAVGPYDIDLDTLRSKSEVIAYLHENGATHTALMDFCADYMEQYHNELCWNYPISDGLHLGTFLILVREGVLSLPYDDADKVDYELFCLDDARMCDRESIEEFLNDWEDFALDLWSVLRSMKAYYRCLD